MGAGGAGTKTAMGSAGAATTADAASAHAAASAIVPPAIGPTDARRPLVAKPKDGGKVASLKRDSGATCAPAGGNGSANARFRIEVRGNLYAIVSRDVDTERLCPPMRSFFKHCVAP